MSDRWYYRIFGQEFGPVSLELVRTLVASGTIAPDDEVRSANRSNWILACAASELCGSSKSPVIGLAVERRTVRDEWFCRGATGDFGPLTLSDLIQLAAIGDLKPDEVVRSRDDDYWRQLRSIRRLCELLPFPDLDRSPSGTVQLSIFDNGGPEHLAETPATASSHSHEDPPDTTFCLKMPSASEIERVIDSSCDAEHDDDEPNVLYFAGAQSTKSDSVQAQSNSYLEELRVPISSRSCDCHAAEVPNKPPVAALDDLISDPLRGDALQSRISSLISIGLVVLTWITSRWKM
jgi:hypothetical protein